MFSTYLVSFAFQDAMDKVSSWDDRLVNSVGRSFTSSVDGWLINHPFFNWLVNHPSISVIAVLFVSVLLIRLLVTVYRAIANAIDRMWLGILRSPFILLKFLFGWERKPQVVPSNTLVTNYEVTNNPEQLQEILLRLEQIQQQQARILLDIAQLKQESLTVTGQIESNSQKLI